MYVSQSEGFVKQDEETNVYKLAQALYDLWQSLRAWNLKLNNTFKNIGFQWCMQENAVYRKFLDGEYIIFQLMKMIYSWEEQV